MKVKNSANTETAGIRREKGDWLTVLQAVLGLRRVQSLLMSCINADSD